MPGAPVLIGGGQVTDRPDDPTTGHEPLAGIKAMMYGWEKVEVHEGGEAALAEAPASDEGSDQGSAEPGMPLQPRPEAAGSD